MAFKLKVHEGYKTGLVAICDVCGDECKGDEANILWTPVEDKVGDLMDFRITCKDECTCEVDEMFGHQYSQQLDVGLVYLLINSRVDMARAERLAALNASL